MKKIITLIFISAVSFLPLQSSFGQSFRYANEALLFSRTSPVTGSARITGIGGAQIALGGDISSAYGNPAGLGFFNRTELSISPTFLSSGNDASYFGMDTYDYKTNLNISNFGFVLGTGRNNNTEGWLGGSLAITYQRINNFNNRFSYEGRNGTSSFVNTLPLFEEGSFNQLINPADPLVQAAVDAFLLDAFPILNEQDDTVSYFYDTYFPINSEQYPFTQKGTVQQSGSQNEWSIAYGGNISDRIYIGAGIGISSLYLNKTDRYEEIANPQLYQDFPDTVNYFPNSSFVTTTNQRLDGGGINANLGIIFRPVSSLSLGLTYKTPTVYQITEEVSYNVESRFEDGTTETGDAFTEFNYSLLTPGKVGLGAAYFFQKAGFISADVEFINYSKSRLTDEQNLLRIDNQAIQNDYTSAVNFRLGGEYRIDKVRVRAGYALQGDPYENQNGTDRYTNTLTGGAGLKMRNYYIDFALAHQTGEQYYSPYQLESDSPVVSIDNRKTTGILTLGLTF